MSLNDSRQVAGSYFLGEVYHGFVWQDGSFTTYDAPGFRSTQLWGINNAGLLVGTAWIGGSPSVAVVYDSGSWTTYLPPPGYTSASARAVNNNGDILVNASNASGTASFLWQGGTYVGPLAIPGFGSGLNDLGAIVGGRSHSPDYGGFLCESGVCADVHFPGAYSTAVADVDNFGNLVGAYHTGSMLTSYYYDKASDSFFDIFFDFEYMHHQATGLAAGGWVTGVRYTDGSWHDSFIGHLVPEPGTFALCALALLGAALRRLVLPRF